MRIGAFEAEVNPVSSGVGSYVAWLGEVSGAAEEARGLARDEGLPVSGRNDFAMYEKLVVAIHHQLLTPLLRDPAKLFVGAKEQCVLEKFPPPSVLDSRLLAGEPSAECVAVGASFRTSLATNARVSSYTFSVPYVLKTFPQIDMADLRERGSEFFTELLDVYFAIFGRGNTLNEYFLDHVLKDNHECPLFCIQFNSPQEAPKAQVSFSHPRREEPALLNISDDLTQALTGKWALAEEFWWVAWETFCECTSAIKNAPPDTREILRKELHRDWSPAASRRMRTWRDRISAATAPKTSLVSRLRDARSKAERGIWEAGNGIIAALDKLYPDDDLSVGQKLGKLLLMVQGSLFLVPWARDDSGVALPVVTVPAIGPGYDCAWTMVPANQRGANLAWRDCHQTVQSLFAKAVRPYEGLRRPSKGAEIEVAAAIKSKWEDELEEIQEAAVYEDLCSDLASLDEKFLELVKAAQDLTGITHEGYGIGFVLVYGAPELLKHVEYVVSNETFSAQKKEGVKRADARRTFGLCCTGHYALFQQDRVAGFIDRIHGQLSIQKMVFLKMPADEDIAEMRSSCVLDDKYRALRWLTFNSWQTEERAAAIVAGSDGVMRVFYNGRLTLTWRRKSDQGKNHWQIGIEAGTDAKSPSGILRGEISQALKLTDEPQQPVAEADAVVQDVVSTLCEISDTPGEGAVFVIGGRPEEYSVLCDMVPDEFKMEWGRVRQLNGLEQKLLRSLAVMDGAIHLAVGADNRAWVCARRFISADPKGPPPGQPSRPGTAPEPGAVQRERALSAEVIVDGFLDQWITHLRDECAGKGRREIVEVVKRLNEWVLELGTRGTRHRAVFQLCLWLQEKHPGEDVPLLCTISSDGPVYLWRLKRCPCGQCSYIWTKKVIS